MEQQAEIIAYKVTDPLRYNEAWYQFEWKGPITKPAIMDRMFYEAVQHQLPWPVEAIPIGEYPLDLRVKIIRLDTGLNGYAWNRLLNDAERLRLFSERLIARFVLMAQVWGLAYVPPYEMPRIFHLGKKRNES